LIQVVITTDNVGNISNADVNELKLPDFGSVDQVLQLRSYRKKIELGTIDYVIGKVIINRLLSKI